MTLDRIPWADVIDSPGQALARSLSWWTAYDLPEVGGCLDHGIRCWLHAWLSRRCDAFPLFEHAFEAAGVHIISRSASWEVWR
jgi:hypothetical protein